MSISGSWTWRGLQKNAHEQPIMAPGWGAGGGCTHSSGCTPTHTHNARRRGVGRRAGWEREDGEAADVQRRGGRGQRPEAAILEPFEAWSKPVERERREIGVEQAQSLFSRFRYLPVTNPPSISYFKIRAVGTYYSSFSSIRIEYQA